MHEIILKATIDECVILNWDMNAGEVNARTLTVELCEEMLNCDMSVVTFKLADGKVYESEVKDGKADIPPINEWQLITIGVYSSDIEGEKCEKRYSPRPVNVCVNVGSYSGNGTEAPTPTPGTFEELLEKINDVEKDTIKNLDRVNVWELDEGVYFVSTSVVFATPNPPIQPNTILVNGGKSLLIITKDSSSIKRHFTLYANGYIYWGWSENTALKALGEVTRAKAEISDTITNDSKEEIPTARAVYNFGLTNFAPIVQSLTDLSNTKENTNNKVNEIDGSALKDEQYPTTRAVYNFGLRILEEVERMLENININASQLTAEAISTFTMNTSAEVEENA